MDATTWDELAKFKRWGSFDQTYPSMIRRYFAPDDDVHHVITTLITSAKQVLHAALYGWDDAEVNDMFLHAWLNKRVRVKIALDASQAAGLGEKPLLRLWPADIYGNDLIIGQSRYHAISHVKLIVADDCVLSGSTNLSGSGEGKQNNEATVIWDPRMAIEVATKISMIFSEMAAQPNAQTHKSLLGPALVETANATVIAPEGSTVTIQTPVEEATQ